MDQLNEALGQKGHIIVEVNITEVTNKKSIISQLQELLEFENEGHFTNVVDSENSFFSTECYSISVDKKIVGFITILIYSSMIEIYRLYISKNFRRNGIAHKSVNLLVNELIKKGATEFCIEISNSNARNFWAKLIKNNYKITETIGNDKICFKN